MKVNHFVRGQFGNLPSSNFVTVFSLLFLPMHLNTSQHYYRHQTISNLKYNPKFSNLQTISTVSVIENVFNKSLISYKLYINKN